MAHIKNIFFKKEKIYNSRNEKLNRKFGNLGEATFQQLELLIREITGRVIRKRRCSGGLTCTGMPERKKCTETPEVKYLFTCKNKNTSYIWRTGVARLKVYDPRVETQVKAYYCKPSKH